MSIGLLHGWEGVSKYLGFSIRTLKSWHYGLLPIPWQKASHLPQARVKLQPYFADDWYQRIVQMRREMKQALMSENSDSQ